MEERFDLRFEDGKARRHAHGGEPRHQRVVARRRVPHHRRQPLRHQRGHALGATQIAQPIAPFPFAGLHRVHAGVDQRQSLHAVGRLADDLQRDPRAHRMAEQGSAGGHARQDMVGHRLDPVSAAIEAAHDAAFGKGCERLAEHAGVADQPGENDERGGGCGRRRSRHDAVPTG